MSIGGAGGIGISHTDIHHVGIQDVGAVPGAAHPARDDTCCRTYAAGDVFSRVRPVETSPNQAGKDGRPVGAVVTGEVVASHVQAVVAGGMRDGVAEREFCQSVVGAFLVDEGDDLGFEARIQRGTATVVPAIIGFLSGEDYLCRRGGWRGGGSGGGGRRRGEGGRRCGGRAGGGGGGEGRGIRGGRRHGRLGCQADHG